MDIESADKAMGDYELVYQSGHNDVWCNGDEHVRTYGGFTCSGNGEFKDCFPCDCALWNDYENGVGPFPL